MRFWRRNPNGEIEGRLRDERPQPSDHLVRAVEEQVRARRLSGFRTGRLVFAVALTLGLLASLAAFGGLSYAASTASSSAASAVKLAKVSVGFQKAAPSAAQKASSGKSKGDKGKGEDEKKNKQKGDDDDKKKKPKCNKGDDRDDPARDQYEDDDDRDDCD
jgi:hypothetical protein